MDGGYSDAEDGHDGGDGDGEEAGPFIDVPAGHGFAREIVWLVEQGVIRGYRDGTFRPAQRITRGEVARVPTQVHERPQVHERLVQR